MSVCWLDVPPVHLNKFLVHILLFYLGLDRPPAAGDHPESFHLFQTAPFITIHSQTLLSVNVTVTIQLFNQSNMGSNHQSINRISGSFLVLIVFIHFILILISEFDSFMNGFI